MRPISKLAIARYVRDCMRREDPPRVSEVARLFGMTAEHLSRQFRGEFGASISTFMKTLQVRRARQLMRTTELTTTRIAYLCGFGTRRTLYRAYRRFTGTSPRRDAGSAGADDSL
jgi:transcriptional regulator GlxA family with amidase domain